MVLTSGFDKGSKAVQCRMVIAAKGTGAVGIRCTGMNLSLTLTLDIKLKMGHRFKCKIQNLEKNLYDLGSLSGKFSAKV